MPINNTKHLTKIVTSELARPEPWLKSYRKFVSRNHKVDDMWWTVQKARYAIPTNKCYQLSESSMSG